MERRKPLSFGIKTGQRYTTHDALLDVWQEADSLPVFEHAWLSDHFLGLGNTPPGPYLESWTLLAALAARTRRLRIAPFRRGVRVDPAPLERANSDIRGALLPATRSPLRSQACTEAVPAVCHRW